MNWVFWNIRCVSKRYKQKEVKVYIKVNKIKLVGLIETKVKEKNAQRIAKAIAPGWSALTNYQHASMVEYGYYGTLLAYWLLVLEMKPK